MNWKDWSEVFKNILAGLAILVGGVWTLYQWDTLFPKTISEVASAAATIRADVSGEFELDFSEVREIDDGTLGKKFERMCKSTPNKTFIKNSIASGKITLNSASKIAIQSDFRDLKIDVVKLPVTNHKISDANPSDISVKKFDDFLEFSKTIPTEDLLVAGAASNRVEAGAEISIPILLETSIPLTCDDYERLIIFTARFDLQPLSTANQTQNLVGSAVKIFTSACKISASNVTMCGLETLAGRAQ